MDRKGADHVGEETRRRQNDDKEVHLRKRVEKQSRQFRQLQATWQPYQSVLHGIRTRKVQRRPDHDRRLRISAGAGGEDQLGHAHERGRRRHRRPIRSRQGEGVGGRGRLLLRQLHVEEPRGRRPGGRLRRDARVRRDRRGRAEREDRRGLRLRDGGGGRRPPVSTGRTLRRRDVRRGRVPERGPHLVPSHPRLGSDDPGTVPGVPSRRGLRGHRPVRGEHHRLRNHFHGRARFGCYVRHHHIYRLVGGPSKDWGNSPCCDSFRSWMLCLWSEEAGTDERGTGR
mmetsp:Transcript_3844/g.8089  ORF Transcript_3844/g.8089 Transcript_3844/m.8089 type:complete len:284 (+) Transcript_3844:531-1382(+)